MIISDRQVRSLAEETKTQQIVARIALEHARGSVAVARDLLENEVCRSRFAREAREYGRDED